MANAGWKQEGKDLMRAISGGCLFGIPILYTMEVWQQGFAFSNSQLLLLLGVALVVNFLVGLASGIREDHSVFGAFADAVTAVGVGLVLSGAILALIGQIDLSEKLTDSLGKIIVEALVVSIGISFVSTRFKEAQNDDEKERAGKSHDDLKRLQLKDDLRDLGGSLSGAIVFAFNVAPTEEVFKIATSLGPRQLALLFVFEFALCYVILIASGLWQRTVFVKDSIFQKPLAEVSLAFATAIIVSSGLVWLVGFSGSTDNLSTFIACVISLSLPAAVGAAGGKLAV